MASEFRKFIDRGNFLDVAIGIVVGAAFGSIVSTFVDGVLMPPIGLILGGIDFENIYSVLKEGAPPGPYNTLQAAQEAGAVTMSWGLLINAIIKFLIIAYAMFLLAKTVNKIMDDEEPEVIEPTTNEILTEIRDLLKKP